MQPSQGTAASGASEEEPSGSFHKSGADFELMSDEPALDLDQLLVLAQSMSHKLETEARRFHPVFAQYAPSIAEFAAEEWGCLFLAEQLVPALRAHCAAAATPQAKVSALGPFLPLLDSITHVIPSASSIISSASAIPMRQFGSFATRRLASSTRSTSHSPRHRAASASIRRETFGMSNSAG